MNGPTPGRIVEIFSGIQGEGMHVGERQLFFRLAGCAFGCVYCDQPEARQTPETALVERTPGVRDFGRVKNPVLPREVATFIQELCDRNPTLHKALAVTGGEPLHQVAFLAELLPHVRSRRLPVMLETNGVLHEALAVLLPHIDIVSMDLKLRSTTGRPMPEEAHRRFLRTALQGECEVYVKAVVGAATTPAEMRRAAGLVARISGALPLVIQPVTPVGPDGPLPPSPAATIALQEMAAAVLLDVRVIPQTHKMMGQR